MATLSDSTITLTRMAYEKPKRDSKGRLSYVWVEGWLAKNADMQDIFPPCPFHEARSLTLQYHPAKRVLRG